MKSVVCVVLLLCFGSTRLWSADRASISVHDVTWKTLGHDENDSMPIGNGDLAANVWTEQSGDLVLLLAKADAWSEMGKLLKLGRVRIQMTPNPFTQASSFTQTLRLEDGTIEIRNGANVLLVWVDANHPVVHVQAKLEHPASLQTKLELWRTKDHPYSDRSPDIGGLFEFGNHPVPLSFGSDTVMPAGAGQITWFHYNTESLYPLVLEQEHLQSLAQKYPDPLLHRCFGAALTGSDLTVSDDHTLGSAKPSRSLELDVTALTEANVTSPDLWKAHLDSLVRQARSVPMRGAFAAHRDWWQKFWDRSWIQVTGTADAVKVSQGYAMQRYMMAASSRGAYPPKFNGGLFTVGHDVPDGRESTAADHNPDFRAWGNSYWNQNNRLLYWPLIMTGDFDLLAPWFDMYLKALPMAEDRTSINFHHAGAAFVETQYFWGLPNLNDFGWDNPTTELKSEWMRYHIQGSLEIISQMLDEYDVTQDPRFVRTKVLPFADPILAYYDLHWPHDKDGTIRLSPTQSLETYQRDAVNPTPDIAGLKAVLGRLHELPQGTASRDQHDRWSLMLKQLPPIAVGQTANGKLPPLGKGDPDGSPTILPAQQYGKSSNRENPELYVVFPYRLYGVGKPDLALARTTFAARRFPFDFCWGQDGPQAAVLGLTSVAKKAVMDEFTDYGSQRFSWFWKTGSDWIPDLDDGGTGMMTLELMLMQTEGRQIRILPAWPDDWAADFKLHAPLQTIIEAHVEHGKITHLHVTPESRAKDVMVVPAESNRP